jgi:hypothetical protein
MKERGEASNQREGELRRGRKHGRRRERRKREIEGKEEMK